MVNNLFKLALLTSSAMLVSPIGGTVFAQESGDGVRTFDTVTVTAQKREESIKDVPVAVSVVGADAFESGTINNAESLVFKVPTVNFRKGNNPRSSALFMRGIGTISFSIGSEPSVSTVVDGVVLNQPGQAFSSLYDIERIEVLRGPQGTLFGKNASSGVLNIVTKGASDEFEGYVSASAFEDEEYKLKASVAGPLAPGVSGRFTAAYSSFDGIFDNLFDGSKVNGYEDLGVRGILDFTPSDTFSLILSVDYLTSEADCCTRVIGNQSSTNDTVNFVIEQAGLNPRGDATREVANDFAPGADQDSYGGSITANWALGGGFELTSITAYRDWEILQAFDQDQLPTNLFVGLRGFENRGDSEFGTFSQELRLQSPQGEALEYQVGLFYWDAENQRKFNRFTEGCTASTLAEVAPGVVPCSRDMGVSTFDTSFGEAEFTSNNQSIALFGQGTYNISDPLRLIGGFRFTNDEVDFDFVRNTPDPGPGVFFDYEESDSTDNTDFSVKAGLQYDVTQDVMSYLTYSQGYKGPGYNVFFGLRPGISGPLEPETSDSFELGLKGQMFGGKAFISAAAFYAEYENYQTNSFIDIDGVNAVSLTNAGSVITQGFEFEADILATDNLSFKTALAYTDATVDQFNVNPATGNPSAPNGSRLPFAPELKAVIGANYFMDAGDLFDIEIDTTYTHTGDQFSNLGEADSNLIEAFGLLNATITLLSEDGKYSLALVANNLLNEDFSAFTQNLGGATGGVRAFNVNRDADQYFGLTLRANF